MGSGREPGTIYNHEYFVLCDWRGVVRQLFTDWELAMDARKPGDYVLTRATADGKLPKSGGGDPAGE